MVWVVILSMFGMVALMDWFDLDEKIKKLVADSKWNLIPIILIIASVVSITGFFGWQAWDNRTITTENVEVEKIACKTYRLEDSSLPKGETRAEGVCIDGERKITYEVQTKSNEEISRKKISEEIAKKVQNNFIYTGTMESTAPAAVYPGNDFGTAESSGYRTGAQCRDGTYSSATGRGACSHHGGVEEWLYE